MYIEKITKYLQGISVAENYNWDIPFDKGHGDEIFSQKDRLSFRDLTNFQSNVHLKTLISEKIINAKEQNETDFLKNIFEWIVHDWGRIRMAEKI